MDTKSRNTLMSRWTLGGVIAGALMVTSATPMPAQQQAAQAPQKKVPFLMVMRQGSPTAWTVADLFGNAYTGTIGTNLVIEQIDIVLWRCY